MKQEIYVHTPIVLKEEEFSEARRLALLELRQSAESEDKTNSKLTTENVYSRQCLLNNWK